MIYADTSALVKLIVPEAETTALRQSLTSEPVALASSDLARTELLRPSDARTPMLLPRFAHETYCVD